MADSSNTRPPVAKFGAKSGQIWPGHLLAARRPFYARCGPDPLRTIERLRHAASVIGQPPSPRPRARPRRPRVGRWGRALGFGFGFGFGCNIPRGPSCFPTMISRGLVLLPLLAAGAAVSVADAGRSGPAARGTGLWRRIASRFVKPTRPRKQPPLTDHQRRRLRQLRRLRLLQEGDGVYVAGQDPGVYIGGVVYYDVNENGSRDRNEPGVPDVAVQIRECTNALVVTAITSAGGDFFEYIPRAGCYYARYDATKYSFASHDGTGDSAVDPLTGRTEGATLKPGRAENWYAGVVPEASLGLTVMPTKSPVPPTPPPTTSDHSQSPSHAPTETRAPSEVPSATPSTSPPTSRPSAAPSKSHEPTRSSEPTVFDCKIRDVYKDEILSSAPILESNYGMVFTVTTPPNPSNETVLEWEKERIWIKSLSLRVDANLLDPISAAYYRVWYRDDGYGDLPRGCLTGWSLVAFGDSLGTLVERLEDEAYNPNVTAYENTILVDTDFESAVKTSDEDDYDTFMTTPIPNGLETFDFGGKPVETYLFRIPDEKFDPVETYKYDGNISFLVILDQPVIQSGPASDGEWDAVDVENAAFDPDGGPGEDVNLRVHVGEEIASYPWKDDEESYAPRRFLGKVWYEEVVDTPCHLYEAAPSQSPSIEPAPEEVSADLVGENDTEAVVADDAGGNSNSFDLRGDVTSDANARGLLLALVAAGVAALLV
ncbi:hypothetical protein ACHAWF_014230 [Thalassiosira exigua]